MEVLSTTALERFLSAYPEYEKTKVFDEMRKTDFARLDAQGQVYLDYTGGNIHSTRLVEQHLLSLNQKVQGNPHSTNPTSATSTQLVERTRKFVLEYFNAGSEYFCIFTPNCSGALKIVGESYPFSADAYFLHSLDNHNSVNGIREFAKARGASFSAIGLNENTFCLDMEALEEALRQHADKQHKLLAFPAQSNVSGLKHPLDAVAKAQSHGWDVLLDTAAFVPTNVLDLQMVKPQFATVSFYKMFGYPTGIGCLLMRKDVFPKMQKPWYAGGTVTMASAVHHGHHLVENHERFEDGTLDYLNIPAVKLGLELMQEVGVDLIQMRVRVLTQWLIGELQELHHANGQPLVRIIGTQDAHKRGGTVAMHFYQPNGEKLPYLQVEYAANKANISLRTGCFCNPGIDEVSNAISYDKLDDYFAHNSSGTYCEMEAYIGTLRGSVRVSMGWATNFADVARFVDFVQQFLA